MIEWMAFEKLEPFGWPSWALFFGRICEQIWLGISIASRTKLPIRQWHFFFRPPYGFQYETEEAQLARLHDYEKTAEEQELQTMSDDDMAKGAEERMKAYQEKQKKKQQSEDLTHGQSG